MAISPAQPSSAYKPDKFIGLLPAGSQGTPTSFVGAYIYDASTGQAINIPRILAASAVRVSHTGDTDETALATITVPAGVMGLNGRLRVTTVWGFNNTGTNKTCRVRFGGLLGTSFQGFVTNTTLCLRMQCEIANRGAANSQVGHTAGSTGFQAAGLNTALVTASVNTAAATTLVISGQLADAGDTVAIESYSVELLMAP